MKAILDRARRADPRDYQILALSSLLAHGAFGLGFEISWLHVAAVLGAAVGTQWAGARAAGIRFEARSALISGIGLCTLFRTRSILLAVAVAVLAIASKFLIRRGDRHLFNPTNFAIVAMLALGVPGWVSPGQYGHLPFMALGIVCLGSVVVTRAARADVTFAFLGAWAAIQFGRSLWLGEPLTIPIHRLENGLLLQFAFFMISDPRTTPDARIGRVVFAVLVALGGAFVHFALFRTNGLLWSLALFTLGVPLLNRMFPGPRYQWRPGSSPENRDPGENHAFPFTPLMDPARGARVYGPAVRAAGRP